jgi:hypothetical protein
VRDWLANGFPSTSFDRAYAIESTEHMDDKVFCFAEAFRTLRCAYTPERKRRFGGGTVRQLLQRQVIRRRERLVQRSGQPGVLLGEAAAQAEASDLRLG